MPQDLYKKTSFSPEQRAWDLIKRMTLEEKLAQLGSVWSHKLLEGGKLSVEKLEKLLKNGAGQLTRPAGATALPPEEVAEFVNAVQRFLINETRLGIPAIVHEECLSGVFARGATLFPQPIALASTWAPDLITTMAERIREQLLAIGVRQGLAPVMDVARDPRWGRVEETFGEDPYLVAIIGTAYVRGLQGDDNDGVVATLKHFAGYGASEGGLNCAPAHIPERELREVYLFPFNCALRVGEALSVMHSYGELDGVPCAAHRWLLTRILREEWGFPGIVVSDYSGVAMLHSYHCMARDKAEAARFALQAGVDVELPETECFGEPLQRLVEQNLIPEDMIDKAAFRVLKLKFALGLFEHPYADLAKTRKVFSSVARAERKTLAIRIAQRSIVLLKNEGVLPLGRNLQAIAVIGPHTNEPRNYLGDYHFPVNLEPFAEFFGIPNHELQAVYNELEITTVLAAIKARVSPNTRVLYAQGCGVTGDARDGFAEAVQAAKEADVAVVVVGDKSGPARECTSGETRDLAGLRLPGVQEELVQIVAETGTPVVLVLCVGRPYVLTKVIDRVKAAVVAWLPGEAGGEPIAAMLFGEIAPGGKLPISFPRSVGELPVYYARKPSGGRSKFWGDYVDESPEPLFPFGHGLSYASFSYSGLKIEPAEVPPEGTVRVSLTVRNVGHVAGDEVVQLYVGRKFGSVTRPVKELKGFCRLTLRPGEGKRVCFAIPVDVLAYHDQEMRLVVEPGDYCVMVGSSSVDIRLTGMFYVTSKRVLEQQVRRYFSTAQIQEE